MKILTNTTGTRSIEIKEEHLATIKKYSLFENLIDSSGIIDDEVVEKLKLNVRSILSTDTEQKKDLLDLCLDVIYHNNMKATGLANLHALYISWKKENDAVVAEG